MARMGLPQNEFLVLYSASGEKLHVEFRARPIDATHQIIVLRDVTLFQAAQELLTARTERLDSIFSNNPDPIFVLDRLGQCVDANDEAVAQLGYGRSALRAEKSQLTGSGLFPGGEYFPSELRDGRTMRFEARYRHRDGRILDFDVKAIPILVAGRVEGAYLMAKDVTKALRAAARLAAQAERLNHLAYYDVLTGLTNRAKFMANLDAAISLGQRHGRRFALHYIDLDGFKAVNDRAGHATGDLALQEAARRLLCVGRRHDTPARIGGDEFVLLQAEVTEDVETEALGARIVHALSGPYVLENRTFELSASVGIATYPDDGEDARDLLRNADAALYRAKAMGKRRVETAARLGAS
jgi:diguanylate cyclase (GGDEF)-like protein/PAS domain S-box-containing protein